MNIERQARNELRDEIDTSLLTDDPKVQNALLLLLQRGLLIDTYNEQIKDREYKLSTEADSILRRLC